MPDINEIVDITISVENSALSRQGFNSLLVAGGTTDFKGDGAVPFAIGDVKEYSNMQAVIDDDAVLPTGEVYKMASVAFAQTPAVPKLYIAYATDQATITAADVNLILQNNSDWYGWASSFQTAPEIELIDATLAAAGKAPFYLNEDPLTDLDAILYPSSVSNVSSLWHTKSDSTSGAKYVNVALASRILAQTPGSYTAAYKTLASVDVSEYTGTEEAKLDELRINRYVPVQGRNVTYDGKNGPGNNGFLDTYIGVQYLKARMAEDVFSTIASVEKLPFTNDGINMIVNTVKRRLQQSIADGFGAPDPAPTVTAPLVTDVNPVDKSNRVLTPVDFVLYEAGAIHKVTIKGRVIA